MNRLIYLLYFVSSLAAAKCESYIDLSHDMIVDVVKGTPIAGDNHAPWDQLKISIPVKTENLKLESVHLTKGEVLEFYLPIAYKVIGDNALIEVSGYLDSIKDFELVTKYSSDGKCGGMQKMLLHNKTIM